MSKPDQSPGDKEWQPGSWSRQAEWSGRRVQSTETGKGQNREDEKKENAKSRGPGKPLIDLETYKTNWHRETRNTGINTLGKTRDTWRGWRQSQGQVKQIRA